MSKRTIKRQTTTPTRSGTAWGQMLLGSTILVSAFLLFLIQPLFARLILPWFGGTPAVWTSCVLVFQALLLVGYTYAHAFNRWCPVKWQPLAHGSVILVAFSSLAVYPSAEWKPTGETAPQLLISLLLLSHVGLPYSLLATTSPLVQSWFARCYPSCSPYRLYGLSNVGSLGALLAYPFLIEPNLGLLRQVAVWQAGFVIYCGLSILSVLFARRFVSTQALSQTDLNAQKVSWTARWTWLVFSACGSALLLSITNLVCYDVAVVPFLWILPLSLYLISFILCFDGEGWYKRGSYGLIALIGLCLFAEGSVLLPSTPIVLSAAVSFGFLFSLCMICHGELARLKPPPALLTEYFLLIALGGVVGGLAVSLLAPLVFNDYWELPLCLCIIAGLVLSTWRRDPTSPIFAGSDPALQTRWRWIAGSVSAVCGMLIAHRAVLAAKATRQDRNFYGIVRITEDRDRQSGTAKRYQSHGMIAHGEQFLDPSKAQTPLLYYGRGSPISGLFSAAGAIRPSLQVGIVGLGTGCLVPWLRPADAVTFYEINPVVIRQAEEDFSFLSHSQAKVRIVAGDARLQLERDSNSKYDILVLDAFSGDAIPAHLLTVEAFQLYLSRGQPDVVLALHVTNRHLDVGQVVWGASKELSLSAAAYAGIPTPDGSEVYSEWILMSRDPSRLALPPGWSPLPPPATTITWTDNFSNLMAILRLWTARSSR